MRDEREMCFKSGLEYSCADVASGCPSVRFIMPLLLVLSVGLAALLQPTAIGKISSEEKLVSVALQGRGRKNKKKCVPPKSNPSGL